MSELDKYIHLYKILCGVEVKYQNGFIVNADNGLKVRFSVFKDMVNNLSNEK